MKGLIEILNIDNNTPNPLNMEKLRKELYLTPDQVKILNKKAYEAKRSIKNYMEWVLITHLEE